MSKKTFCLILWLSFAPGLIITAHCGMTSSNYEITTSVMSGSGQPEASSSYKMNSTLGQPSPLHDAAQGAPSSTNFELQPGFWHSLGAASGECGDLSGFASVFGTNAPEHPCDFDHDGDIDGIDLALF